MAPHLSWLLLLVLFSLVLLITARIWRRRKVGVVRVISLVSKAIGIPSYRRSLSQLAQELARARRYQYPLTVVVLNFDSDQFLEQKHSVIAKGEKWSVPFSVYLTQFISLLGGTILRDALRESDIITYDVVNNRYIMLLTESTKSQATQAVRRLEELLFKRTLARLRAGIAEFPVDGLTIEDLVSNAQTAGNHQPIGEVVRGSIAREA